MKVKESYTLKEFFDKFGITQKIVAEESGISYQMMRQYVGGFKNIDDVTLRDIEKAVRRIGRKAQKVKII